MALSLLTLTACTDRIDATGGLEDRLCTETVSQDDARPDLLVIGDSISIGYTPTLQATLTAYDVVHNPCNAMSSNNGIKKIDSWLAMRTDWHAITFNHGLWDIRDGINTSEDTYRSNLTEVATKIKARTTRPLFILATRVPINAPYRTNDDIVRYNEIATEVMVSLGIPVLDLYSASESIIDMHINPVEQNDVHYTSEGYETLGEAIVSELEALYAL